MADLKPAYLIHGDDHGGVAERRASLLGLAQQQGDASSVEVLAGDAATPEGIAGALAAMTFAIGRRVILVDGAERFKQAEVESHLAPAIKQMPPDTTLALFAREEARAKAPAALHAAVKAAGGQIIAHSNVKPWELPQWVRTQARRLGLELDAAASKALVAQVGERQQRLLRELEKIALEIGTEDSAPVAVGVEQVESRAAHSSVRRAFTLADALVGGDVAAALRTYLSLEAQGERIPSLSFQIAARLRDALAVSARLQAGEPAKEIIRSLRMPPKAAERFVADVRRADSERLRNGLVCLADLEVDLRGGASVLAARRPAAGLSEKTVAVLTIGAIAGQPA
ncbi:MAG: DNA polymerase III subunit delta [Solirubrobacteraceae bacterium]